MSASRKALLNFLPVVMKDRLIADNVRMAADASLAETLPDSRKQAPADDYRIVASGRPHHRGGALRDGVQGAGGDLAPRARQALRAEWDHLKLRPRVAGRRARLRRRLLSGSVHPSGPSSRRGRRGAVART